MMVDHYFTPFGRFDERRQLAGAFRLVVIHIEQDVRLADQLLGILRITFVDKNIFRARHPLEKGGKFVRYNHVDLLFPDLRQEMVHPQRRTDGIAVGRNMSHQHKPFRSVNIILEALYLSFIQHFRKHRIFFF